MNFENQLEYFKDNYEVIKKRIKKKVKENMVYFGSGGSINAIILEDNYAIKIIPNQIYPLSKIKFNNDYLEADIYKKLTDEFIKENKTPHIVGFIKRYLLEDIKIVFPQKCYSLDDKILIPPSNRVVNDKLCFLKKSFEKNLIEKKASILILEKCPFTIENEYYNLTKLKNKNKLDYIYTFLDRTIFQVIFTLAVIQDKYPDFIHNDLFLRNILITFEAFYDINDYVQYNINGKSYYLYAYGQSAKINDFGYTLGILDKKSTLLDEHKYSVSSFVSIKDPKKDIYNFFYDLYYVFIYLTNKYFTGQIKIKAINTINNIIGKYFDYKTINYVNTKNNYILDNINNISESKILSNTVKKPIDYFKDNTFAFYQKLPRDARIVKIYN